jgi:hypothetical protein
MHIQLAMTNSTTLEQEYSGCFIQERKRTKNLYDLGNKKNLKLMFGDNIFLAFLPIYTTQGDGMHWEHNPNCEMQKSLEKVQTEEPYDPYLEEPHLHNQFIKF